jgi:hypothetical protein
VYTFRTDVLGISLGEAIFTLFQKTFFCMDVYLVSHTVTIFINLPGMHF